MNARALVIGQGKWSEAICRTLLTFKDLEVMTVTRKWREVLAKLEPNGETSVIIASPAATHAEIALECLEAGFPCFIEKPMCLLLADAQHIQEHAETKNITVDHTDLFNLNFLAFKREVSALSRIDLRIELGGDGPLRDDINALWDYGPHGLAMALKIFEMMPADVACESPARGKYKISMSFGLKGMAEVLINNRALTKSRRAFLPNMAKSPTYDGLDPAALPPLTAALASFFYGWVMLKRQFGFQGWTPKEGVDLAVNVVDLLTQCGAPWP